jgi:hypothetical protein
MINRRKDMLLGVLVLLFWASGVCAVEPAIRSITPADGATGVFNYQPICVEFDAVPADVAITLEPAVAGNMATEGSKVIFQPTAKYLPKTHYTVKVSWNGQSVEYGFTSVNELAEHYFEDFASQMVGFFPLGWVTREGQFGIPNFQVVEFPQSASGKALRGFNGGVDHSEAYAPSFTMIDPNSRLLLELTVWLDNGAVWATYLHDAAKDWPPYLDIRGDLSTKATGTQLQRYKIMHIYHPSQKKFEVFLDYAPVNNSFTATKEFRGTPPSGKRDYQFALYVRGSITSDVFWESIRIAELGE